jgi:hypothetical protein
MLLLLLLLLRLLLAAAGACHECHAAGPHSRAQCGAALRRECGDPVEGQQRQCGLCADRAQHTLRTAGCSAADVAAFCTDWPPPPPLDAVSGGWRQLSVATLWNNSDQNQNYWKAADLPTITNFIGSVGSSLPYTWGGYYMQCYKPVPEGCPRDLMSFQSLEVAPYAGAGAVILRVDGSVPTLDAARWLPHTSLRQGRTAAGVSIATAMTLQLKGHSLLWNVNITGPAQNLHVTIDAMAMAQRADWSAAGFFFHTPEDPAQFLFTVADEPGDRPPTLLAQSTTDGTFTAMTLLAADGSTPSLRLNQAGRGGQFALVVRGGTTSVLCMAMSIGNSSESVVQAHKLLIESTTTFDAAVASTVNGWERIWRSAFTPLNSVYSGSLPTIQPADSRVARLYYAGVLAVLAAERHGQQFSSACSAAATGCRDMPRWWVVATGNEATVPTPNTPAGSTGYGGVSVNGWDTAMAASVIALLDPASLRALLSVMVRSNDTQFCVAQATDGVLTKCANSWNALSAHSLLDTYVRFTNDTAFLHEDIGNSTPLQYIQDLAWSWQVYTTQAEPSVVDYSADERAYLEVVPTYIHACAAHQAQFVDMMRRTADMLDWIRDGKGQSERLRAEVLMPPEATDS